MTGWAERLDPSNCSELALVGESLSSIERNTVRLLVEKCTVIGT